MGVDSERRIPQSTLNELRGILISSLSRENLGSLDQHQHHHARKVRFMDFDAGAAPVETNHRQSRPSSANKGRERPKSTGHTLHWFACVGKEPEFDNADDSYYDYDTAGSLQRPQLQQLPADIQEELSPDAGAPRDGSGSVSRERERDREERARSAREKQQNDRQRKLDELREQALAAQRFRQQKEEERRKRIDEMRTRDTDRRLQVEERKRAIWEAERERREAILRRNEEREARLECRRKSNAGAGVFAFGSSTPRMLEPADTGGTFWGHRRATSTSNVMFAALPLSRRSSERELDPNKKRATSASGLDRQPGEDFRMSTSMYEVFHWQEFGAPETTHRQTRPQRDQEDNAPDPAPWSRVARRRTDLVPTIPAPRDSSSRGGSSTPRTPGRAYSMSRLDQLAQPRRPKPIVPLPLPSISQSSPPTRPPRHRSMGNLAASATHRSMGNLTAGPSPPPRKHLRPATQPGSAMRSGEVTPGSPSRPGSSMSSASTIGGTMTSSITGAITVNRRPRTAPRRPRPASIAGTGVTTPPHIKTITGVDGKIVGDKPPLPRVHSAGINNKKPSPASAQPPAIVAIEKPQVPRRTHKQVPQKSPRVTPRSTPLQSPATDLPPSNLQDVTEGDTQELVREGSSDTITLNESQIVNKFEAVSINATDSSEVIATEITTQVTKDNNEIITELQAITVVTKDIIEENKSAIDENSVKLIEEIINSQEIIDENMKNLTINESKATAAVSKDSAPVIDPLDGADMTSSMMARKGLITTEEEAKAALAERRRLAREEAEKQAERERLRLEEEAAAEAERQRQEEEMQRRLEEETIRLSELQKQAEEERLQQAILEAQKRAEEENVRREEEARAKAEREAAEARAREEAEKQRKENAQRLQKEEQEREARRRRVEAIMLRTRQAKNKKDGDKSPTEESKSDEVDQKLSEKPDDDSSEKSINESQTMDKESAYEMSVREREEDLFNHMALHNQTSSISPQSPQEPAIVMNNGIGSFQNGVETATTNGSVKNNLIEDSITLNGHSKNDINELNNFFNNGESQFNSVALDNTVKQNIVTNNILDISDLDLLNTANSNNPFILGINSNGNLPIQSLSGQQQNDVMNQLIDVSKTMINEDSINSNQPNNSPFITSFQDNQENRDISLL